MVLRAKVLFLLGERDIYIEAGLAEVNFANREGNCIRKKCAPKSVARRGIH